MIERGEDPQAEERIEDLDVPESESEEVKGGVGQSIEKFEFRSRGQKVMPTDQKAFPTDQISG